MADKTTQDETTLAKHASDALCRQIEAFFPVNVKCKLVDANCPFCNGLRRELAENII